jgi:uncharacterized protein
MDITPQVPEGRQLIQGYGGGGFLIAGQRHQGSVLVRPERTEAWSVAAAEAITLESLEGLVATAPEEQPIQILLVGCGAKATLAPAALRRDLRTKGISLEWMDTGAACRTFNVLLAEERRVAAALIAVD